VLCELPLIVAIINHVPAANEILAPVISAYVAAVRVVSAVQNASAVVKLTALVVVPVIPKPFVNVACLLSICVCIALVTPFTYANSTTR
jgi:hypothetical protein